MASTRWPVNTAESPATPEPIDQVTHERSPGSDTAPHYPAAKKLLALASAHAGRYPREAGLSGTRGKVVKREHHACPCSWPDRHLFSASLDVRPHTSHRSRRPMLGIGLIGLG